MINNLNINNFKPHWLTSAIQYKFATGDEGTIDSLFELLEKTFDAINTKVLKGESKLYIKVEEKEGVDTAIIYRFFGEALEYYGYPYKVVHINESFFYKINLTMYGG